MTRSHYFSAFLVVILIIIDLQLRLLIPFGTAQTPGVSVSPTEGNAGVTMNLTVTGTDTAFNGATTISFTCSDITVNSVTVNSATEMIVNVSIAATTGCLNTDRLGTIRVDEDGDTITIYELSSAFQIRNTVIPVNKTTNILFGSIAGALLDANDGDTILVNDGSYMEDIIVDKEVKIVSVNGKNATSITGEDCSDTDYLNIVTLSHDNAWIEGFTLIQPGDCLYNGISATGFNNLTIKSMNIDGGFGKGIVLANSSGDSINDCLISGNQTGIDLANTQNVTVSGNNISGNSSKGLMNNSQTLITAVTAKNNWWGDATGPQHTISNSAGSGNGISDGAIFSPWCADVACGTYDWLSLNASDLPNLFTAADIYYNGWILRADDVSPPADYQTSFVDALQKFDITVPTGSGNSTVLLPQGTRLTATDSSVFDPSELMSEAVATGTLSGLSGTPVGSALRFGLPSVGISASQALTFSMFVGSSLNGQTFNLYRSTSPSAGWTTTGLGATTCTVGSGLCGFTSNRASYFVAVDPDATPPDLPPEEEATTTPPTATTTPVKAGSYAYSVSINHGATKTGSEEVGLTLYGGPDAAMMLISENATFPNAKKINYSTVASTTLSGGNGNKTVYVKFINAAGQALEVVSDSIILEKAAEEIKKPEIKPEIKKEALSGDGDIYVDGKVNLLDFNFLMVEWGKLKSLADLNGDGSVNAADLDELLAAWSG
jgi:parallel beta-helix repeat protein